MSAISSRELYQLLKEKLNLPARTISMNIDLRDGEPAIISVTSLADRIEGAAIAEAVGKYQLVNVGARPETLDQKLDRMADEAKAEIAEMAGAYLYNIGASSFPVTPFQKKFAAAWKTLEINLGRFS
ncbi:hypothetical protein ACVTMO_16650 [Pseudomonas segetis]